MPPLVTVTGAAPLPTVAAFPSVPATVDGRPPPARAELDYDRLFTTTIPPLDSFAAAEELGGMELGEPAVVAAPYAVGDRATFQTADGPRQAELVAMAKALLEWHRTHGFCATCGVAST